MLCLFRSTQSPQFLDQIACRDFACSLVKLRYRRDKLIPVGERDIGASYSQSA